MLIEFKSQATGTITMTGDAGTRILAVIGRSASPKGIITVAQLPAAIAALEAAVAAEKAGQATAPSGAKATGGQGAGGPSAGRDNNDDDDEAPAEVVTLAQRAWPLIALFKEALAAKKDVTWGV